MTGKLKAYIVLGIIALAIVAVLMMPGKQDSVKESADRIGVVYVEGVITGSGEAASFLTESGGANAVIKQLHRVAADNSVKAIVLRINSPGGSTAATEEIGEEIKKIRKNGKIVVTSMGDMAASGGYWLAACTDVIYANPSTLTGSIGVYMPYSNWEELYKKIGIRQERIKSGAHKDILSNDRPMTDEERVILQTMVNEIYENFVTVVAEGRKLDREQVKVLADGRIYTGKQAKEAGLVDELGNLYDAIDKAAELAGIEGKPQWKDFNSINNPLTELLSLEGKLAMLKKVLLEVPTENEVKSVAPMVLPERWQE